MSEHRQLFPPPPAHPSRSRDVSHSALPANSLLRRVPPPPPPARPVPPLTNSQAAPVATVPTTPAVSQQERIPGGVEDIEDIELEDTQSIADVQTICEEELSETQLRELYDEEEINRFLYLFSTYVTEVSLPHSSTQSSASVPSRSESDLKLDVAEAMTAELDGDDDDGWVNPRNPREDSQDGATESLVFGEGPAAWVASKIIPLLPPPQAPARPFSIKRARLTANRLFLALEPTYYPILKSFWDLATWKNYGTSLLFCAIFWWLWYNGLLLCGLFLRLLYALLRRQFLPYPSLRELRQYRRELELAEHFSRNVVLRFATSPAMNVKDMWTTFKEYRASKKKTKNAQEVPTSAEEVVVQEQIPEVPLIVVDEVASEKDPASEEEDIVTSLLEEEHVWGSILQIANRIADVHERIKNIFLWRRPRVSAAYGMVLFILSILVALLPAKVLVRGVTMGAGVFFWHIVPVLAALPASERARIPPPLTHSPTDAEYAMELISQRVARGLPIKPKHRKRKTPFGSREDITEASALRDHSSPADNEDPTDISVDWTKWGERVVKTKELAGNVKEVLKDGNWKNLDSWTSFNPLRPRYSLNAGPQIETHTFPAQRGKSPGLLTMTDSLLYFTPLTSSKPELTIKLRDVLGVKKSGVAKGLKIRWTETEPSGIQQERQERFFFVGDRDDLFARLVGWNNNKWLNA